MADDERDDPPLTVDSLADLQAGLHDDDTAARLRKKVRTDPDAQQTVDALNRVRGDVAALSSDGASAPEVDPAVVNRIGAALRAQHAIRRGGLPRSGRLAVAAAGLIAVAVAAWLGTRALITAPASITSRPTTIEHITVSRPPLSIPLSDQQILALVDHEPDFGPLTDPRRRASCLSGLGYPTNARVLGARPIDIAGHPAVLLVLPGDGPGDVQALAVAPTCSAANTGLSADRIVTRP
ncbi:MAG TPA: hypothetical protein VGH54_15770 [Mycobacterium sp.]|uniref:hypothetical protein n=1 Tax=Mycobacterium sp. TaxID=1785 RepID=UPI002F3FBCB1